MLPPVWAASSATRRCVSSSILIVVLMDGVYRFVDSPIYLLVAGERSPVEATAARWGSSTIRTGRRRAVMAARATAARPAISVPRAELERWMTPIRRLGAGARERPTDRPHPRRAAPRAA